MADFNQQLTAIFSNKIGLIFFMLWSLIWKGVALWKAGQKKHLPWFIILLIVNTMGLLEIAYIFYLNRFDLDHGRLLKFLDEKCCKSKKTGSH